MEKFGSGIRNKHPGSATLAYFDLFVSEGVSGTDQRLPYGRSDSQRLWHYYQVSLHRYLEGMERKKDKKKNYFFTLQQIWCFLVNLPWREGGWCYFMILRGDIIFVIFILILIFLNGSLFIKFTFYRHLNFRLGVGLFESFATPRLHLLTSPPPPVIFGSILQL
jgi:hypothetical protein